MKPSQEFLDYIQRLHECLNKENFSCVQLALNDKEFITEFGSDVGEVFVLGVRVVNVGSSLTLCGFRDSDGKRGYFRPMHLKDGSIVVERNLTGFFGYHD